MALRSLSQISRLEKFLVANNSVNKTQNNLIEIRRNFGRKKPVSTKKICEDKCPNKTCKKPPKKRSFWEYLCGTQQCPKTLPPKESCKIEQSQSTELVPVPYEEVKKYSSWGPAYLIQKDLIPLKMKEEAKQQLQNAKQTQEEEPAPNFMTAEQRLLYLSDKKLHPLYKIYKDFPKRKNLGLPEREFYKTRSGPIGIDEIPQEMKVNSNVIKAKNAFDPNQNVESLQGLVAKIAEMRKNEKPTMEGAILKAEVKSTKQKAAFDTAHQEDKFWSVAKVRN
ncbi:hypothetical protein ILUMI_08671 [Ignelater luminosus]|uniref:Uncharacterized protein n=1 Tax=Ignelater luminosus TaxID=2038154 RepID=A0A8K0D188_IGNLU|nr:hypothetical protein ILUMI_08671 [Ignelater luminosus]